MEKQLKVEKKNKGVDGSWEETGIGSWEETGKKWLLEAPLRGLKKVNEWNSRKLQCQQVQISHQRVIEFQSEADEII